jgi:hypothetical protein
MDNQISTCGRKSTKAMKTLIRKFIEEEKAKASFEECKPIDIPAWIKGTIGYFRTILFHLWLYLICTEVENNQ